MANIGINLPPGTQVPLNAGCQQWGTYTIEMLKETIESVLLEMVESCFTSTW